MVPYHDSAIPLEENKNVNAKDMLINKTSMHKNTYWLK
jgi:hypothetical protein